MQPVESEVAVSARAKLCMSSPLDLNLWRCSIACRTEESRYHQLYRFCTLRDESNEKCFKNLRIRSSLAEVSEGIHGIVKEYQQKYPKPSAELPYFVTIELSYCIPG